MTILNPDDSGRGLPDIADKTIPPPIKTSNHTGSTKFSIVSRLNFTLRLLLLSLMLTGISSTVALIYINSIESNVISRVAPLINLNNKLNAQVLSANLNTRSYLVTRKQTFLNQYQQSIKDYSSTYNKALPLQNVVEKQQKYLQNENDAAQNSFSTLNHLIQHPVASQSSAADLIVIVNQTNGPEQIFENQYTAANLAYRSQQNYYTSQIRLVSLVGIGLVMLIFLVSLILGLRQSYFISSNIRGMLERLIGTLKAQERGDSAAQANFADSNEELELANAINNMIARRNSLQVLLEQQYANEKISRKNLEEERALREAIATTLYKDLDATSAFQRAIEGFGKALRADRAIVRVMANGKPGPTIFQWNSPSTDTSQSDEYSLENADQLRQLLYQESDQLSNALTRGSYICIEDVAIDERLSEYSRLLALQTGLRAFMSVPVVGESGPEAILVALIEGKTRTWSDRDIQIATTLAAGLGATLAAIRLYDIERQGLESMRKLDKVKDEFLASISHELRTPLTSIIGYLELLKDEIDDGNISAKYTRMLDAIDRNSVRLLDLIENVLTASRIESGKLEISASTFPISQLISTSTETIIPQASAKQIDIDIQLSPELPDITGDITLLDRAMLNLLSNAVKFTPPTGTITVTAKAKSGNLEITVADTGMGISEEEIGKMFTKFYRTTNAKEEVIQGTGLGLSITKAIIEAHSGTIKVESTLGEGSKFTFTIPIGKHQTPKEP